MYRTDEYEAYSGLVIRDAQNEAFILDQIRIRTGLNVKVLSNSEHRFISYKTVASQKNFEDMDFENAKTREDMELIVGDMKAACEALKSTIASQKV